MAKRHLDSLDVNLYYPMLTPILKGTGMKMDMLEIANEIKKRWVAKVPKESGNAASTARTQAIIGGRRKDRWEAVFEAGGPRAPYVVELENEHHILEEVLREMGWELSEGGQGRVIGHRPRQRTRSGYNPAPRTGEPDLGDTETVTLYHRTTEGGAARILQEGFRGVGRHGGRVYFSTQRDDPHYLGYGDEELSVQVPRNAITPDRNDRGNAVHVSSRFLRESGGSISHESRPEARAAEDALRAAERGQ